jgi:hypothetical protein
MFHLLLVMLVMLMTLSSNDENLHLLTQKLAWWDLGRMENPFLLVMNKWVGTTRHLMGSPRGSPSQRWKTNESSSLVQ